MDTSRSMSKFNGVEFLVLKGSEISRYKNEIAKLRIEIFRDFPYLYEGDLEYEEKYLRVYESSESSIMVLAIKNKTVIGATTALPLKDENDYVKIPFLNSGLNIEKIFYFGESVLKKEYRGLGIGKMFFKFREEHALSFGNFDITCFCGVDRPNNHKLKPPTYQPLDLFWTSLGYRKEPKLISSFSWKDIGDSFETEKPMIYWMKEWKASV